MWNMTLVVWRVDWKWERCGRDNGGLTGMVEGEILICGTMYKIWRERALLREKRTRATEVFSPGSLLGMEGATQQRSR